ncbi:MAG: hypothetical protein R3F50_16015 [Gammaproteobacteria bacterium]
MFKIKTQLAENPPFFLRIVFLSADARSSHRAQLDGVRPALKALALKTRRLTRMSQGLF